MYAKDHVTIIDRREQLRIKINSLAHEARLIRKAELKTHTTLRTELYLHRINVVRLENRAANLAMGFIKGRTWEQMEANPHTVPDWSRVKHLLKKFGPRNFVEPECFKVNKHTYVRKVADKATA